MFESNDLTKKYKMDDMSNMCRWYIFINKTQNCKKLKQKIQSSFYKTNKKEYGSSMCRYYDFPFIKLCNKSFQTIFSNVLRKCFSRWYRKHTSSVWTIRNDFRRIKQNQKQSIFSVDYLTLNRKWLSWVHRNHIDTNIYMKITWYNKINNLNFSKVSFWGKGMFQQLLMTLDGIVSLFFWFVVVIVI